MTPAQPLSRASSLLTLAMIGVLWPAFRAGATPRDSLVDNVPPPAPHPFVGQYGNVIVRLHWGLSPAPDFLQFRLYRGPDHAFVPGPATLLIATTDTAYTDPNPGMAGSFYKLTAVDSAGNEGPFALVAPPHLVGIDPRGNVALAVRPLGPSPTSDRRLAVELALHDAGPARLELIDVAGRVVRSREVGALGSGVHTIDLSGQGPLRAGLYFLRLRQGGRTATARTSVVP